MLALYFGFPKAGGFIEKLSEYQLIKKSDTLNY
jgi:hypothetical protein